MSGALAGQTIFVTGAAKGTGRVITLELAGAGADIVLAGRDTAACDRVAEEVRAMGRRAAVVPCDVTDEAAVITAVAKAQRAIPSDHWGLVNIAGGTGPSGKMLWDHDLAEFEEVYAVNVTGPFLTMKHLLPVMNGQGRGCVINIGGTFGFKGVRQASAYGSTKWALRGLTKSAALEAGAYGVRVNMVSPGGVEGPRLTRQLGEQAAREGIAPEEAVDRFRATSALGQFSTDQDVALAVVYLMGPGGRNVTGQDLLVDGGTIV
ncbi:SDR family NAD(P)-dependent oxidoreductase [Marinibacterium profundimaris]|uniref:Short-chain dehydrogenase n=1 Tax=Marinibacterium profundimaris TaxID=1679460 RepID=A0A225NJ85_9RHOB|nr:SDR family NAD(P)-dependent oxidoreductase [Marinibacterium profundimaris]OWU73650.1 hypothetical protein ATO3_13515 [Marinibacterium profundimaris]